MINPVNSLTCCTILVCPFWDCCGRADCHIAIIWTTTKEKIVMTAATATNHHVLTSDVPSSLTFMPKKEVAKLRGMKIMATIVSLTQSVMFVFLIQIRSVRLPPNRFCRYDALVGFLNTGESPDAVRCHFPLFHHPLGVGLQMLVIRNEGI